MSKFQHDVMLRIVKILNVLMIELPFAACWFLYYSHQTYANLAWEGHFAILGLFFILYIALGKIYDAFWMSMQRVSELVYGQILGAMATDGILYIVICLMSAKFCNLLPGIAAIAGQLVMAAIWASCAHKWYYKTFPPQKTAVVYDVRHGMEKLINEYGLSQKYDVQVTLSVSECLADLSILDGMETVFVSGVHSHERNIILKHCVGKGINMFVIPRVGDVIMSGAWPMHMFHLPMLRVGRYMASPEFLFIKRAMDIVISLLALIILSPLLLITAIAVKSDGGPAFYKQVRLTKDGKQFEIGSYGPENVRVVADASAITEPGTYEVPLVVSDNGTRSYTVTSISPATVTLTFETRATKLLQIQADITGLTTPANYIAPEDEIVLEPSTVEVSGAESLISRVERAVIEVDFSREVSSTQQQNSKIVYYDAEGNKLETEEVAYFHQDVSSVAVTIPVKRVATLPLTVSFLNVPENFPVDELSYSLSVDSITVAAEDSVLRNHSSLVLGYIDFKQMNLLTSSQMDFAVQLPEGFTDMDDIEVVTVSFEADDLASTNLSLKNFQLVNVPEGFTVTVEESALRVYVLGKKSIISGIAAGDFVVKVDLSDMRTRAGKYEMPVSIYAPTKGYVWAVGEYSVTVDAKAS